MEVGTINLNSQTAIHSAGAPFSAKSANQEVVIPFAKEKPVFDEKVMMDLQDVQHFLYMLIGSEIKVESDNNSIGNAVNAVA
ncbi:MAG TPA: hypothetical protein PK926_01170 [Spirochaetota bacterium]|nr:hypothetical protein [Spirochaetota bacterium]HPI88639.1 hypothetical protein [Spirochaetota bacterium]HPR49595.1 hypothetical protein [Spirochaetota bacterium]